MGVWNFVATDGHCRVSPLLSDGRTTGHIVQIELPSGTFQVVRNGRTMILSLNGRRIEPSDFSDPAFGSDMVSLVTRLRGQLPDAERASQATTIARAPDDLRTDIRAMLSGLDLPLDGRATQERRAIPER